MKMGAGVRSARHFHPHLAQRAEDRDFEGRCRHLHVGVGQLLDDQVPGEARVPGSALLEPVEQVVGVALHDQPDADNPPVEKENSFDQRKTRTGRELTTIRFRSYSKSRDQFYKTKMSVKFHSTQNFDQSH